MQILKGFILAESQQKQKKKNLVMKRLNLFLWLESFDALADEVVFQIDPKNELNGGRDRLFFMSNQR